MTDTSPDIDTTVYRRPNGKEYRAKLDIVAVGIEGMNGEDYVAVLRTHDVGRARALARPYRLTYLTNPRLVWLRQVVRRGEPFFDYDDERGAPAVLFTETEEADHR